MKTTTEKAVTAFRILYGDKHLGGTKEGARLNGMKDDDKFALLKIMKELKPIATSFDDFLKDSADRLKPQGIESIQAKVAQREPLNIEEQKIWSKYNSDVTKCIEDELAKKIEFTFAPLSEEGFKGLLASNDFPVFDIMVLDEVIGQ